MLKVKTKKNKKKIPTDRPTLWKVISGQSNNLFFLALSVPQLGMMELHDLHGPWETPMHEGSWIEIQFECIAQRLDWLTYCIRVVVANAMYLQGLAMIFADQENPFIIFRSKEINIHFKKNNKIPTDLLK